MTTLSEERAPSQHEGAAEAFRWDAAIAETSRDGKYSTGRGIAYTYRSQTIAVQIAEVK
jgi:hypothetical protein